MSKDLEVQGNTSEVVIHIDLKTIEKIFTNLFPELCKSKNGKSFYKMANEVLTLCANLKDMQIKSFDLRKELNELVYFFSDIVEKAKRRSSSSLRKLETAEKYAIIIRSIMNENPTGKLNDADEKNLKNAIKKISETVKDLISEIKLVYPLLKKSKDAARKLKNEVFLKKDAVGKSFNQVKVMGSIGTAGTATGLGIGGSLVASSSFGCAGTLAVAGTIINPVDAVLTLGVCGLAASTPVMALVNRYYKGKQNEEIVYLNKIKSCVTVLEAENKNILNYLQEIEDRGEVIDDNLDSIQNCLESQSMHYVYKVDSSKLLKCISDIIITLKETGKIEFSVEKLIY